MRRRGIGAALVAATFAMTGPVSASRPITDLGPPSSEQLANAAAYFPLDGFHHTHVHSKGRKAVLVFVGTQPDTMSAVERWPVVKALDQFGGFAGVAPSSADGSLPPLFAAVSTFDWSKAKYRSRYLTFTHVDMLDNRLRPFQRPTGLAATLYYRYARARVSTVGDASHAQATMAASQSSSTTSRRFPLVFIGGYVQTASQFMVPGDFVQFATPEPSGVSHQSANNAIPFATVQDSLLRAEDPPGARSHLVEDVNSEANVISALICYADGRRPRKICDRSVIKVLLRKIK